MTPQRQHRAFMREIGRAAQERGAANEERLRAAVIALRDGGTTWIIDARAAIQWEDAAGVDVVVRSDVGDLYLQSKSSRAGLVKFRGGPTRTLPIEPVIVALDDATTRMRALVALDALRAERQRNERAHDQPSKKRPPVAFADAGEPQGGARGDRKEHATTKQGPPRGPNRVPRIVQDDSVARVLGHDKVRCASENCPNIGDTASPWARVEDGRSLCASCSVAMDDDHFWLVLLDRMG